MTVVRPNSIAGINSITVQTGQALNIHDASGNLIRNITSSTGISTFQSIDVTSGDLKVGISTLFTDNSTGKTGLGTDIPSSRLQVCGKSTLHGYSEASVEWGDTSNLGALSFTSTTGNPIVRANSGKDLVFQTNGGNTRLTILSDGQVTVGSDTEGHADADELTLAGTRTGMTIRSANDNYGNIFFSDATSGTGEYVGAVQYYHADNTLRLKTSSADKLIINSAGDVNITGITTAAAYSTSSGQQIANRNVVHNGDMNINQRANTTQVTILYAGYYTVDRWKYSAAGGTSGTWTMVQDTDVPDGQGFNHSLKTDCQVANASPDAGDYVILTQAMEGLNVQRFNKGTSDAKTMTLSFWAKSTLTGNFVAELNDNDNTRHVAALFQTTTSWKKHVITFPADTTGAFGDDNGDSLYLNFWLSAGSTFTSGTLATTWASRSDANRAAGVQNLMSSTSNNFWITGVQLEAGSAATPFEFRDHGDQLSTCQRYYQRWKNGYAAGNAVGTSDIIIGLPLNTALRSAPSIAAMDLHRSGNKSATISIVSVTYTAGDIICEVRVGGWTGGNAVTDENAYVVTPTNSTVMKLSAEL